MEKRRKFCGNCLQRLEILLFTHVFHINPNQIKIENFFTVKPVMAAQIPLLSGIEVN